MRLERDPGSQPCLRVAAKLESIVLAVIILLLVMIVLIEILQCGNSTL